MQLTIFIDFIHNNPMNSSLVTIKSVEHQSFTNMNKNKVNELRFPFLCRSVLMLFLGHAYFNGIFLGYLIIKRTQVSE